MQIIPALLTNSAETFTSQYNSLKQYYSRFQIDIADNSLVPNTTLQIEHIQPLIRNQTGQYDFHLMVTDYQSHIQKLLTLQSPIGIIFIHASLQPDLSALTSHYPHLTFGLVLDLGDEVNTILSNYKDMPIEHFQIMSIVSGFQGSTFHEESLQKVEQLRAVNYKSKIYIDGGINDKSIPVILQQKEKPDFLCVGSYLVKAESLEQRVKQLKDILS